MRRAIVTFLAFAAVAACANPTPRSTTTKPPVVSVATVDATPLAVRGLRQWPVRDVIEPDAV